MKLKKEYIQHQADGECFLISTGAANFSGMVKGNKTFGAIVSLMQENTTEEEIVENMCKRFDAPKEIIERDVRKAIEELGKIGAIDE